MRDIEDWKNIRKLPGYKISSHGRVMGIRGICKTPLNHDGYPQLRVPSRKFCSAVHRLVAAHFFGGIPDNMQVNHKDCDKTNNRLENLEIVTPKDNIGHAITNGLRTAKSNLQNNSIFSDAEVSIIKYAINAGFKNTAIAQYFKCSHSTISKIRVGKHYPNISI